MCPGFAMLSVPTLWTVFVINFLALGLIWAYVIRSYPSFSAARFWTGSSFIAALGAALAMLRVMTDSLLPLLAAGTAMVFALCLAAMGIQKFFDRKVAWRGTWLVTGVSLAGMSFFMFGYDSAPARIAIFTIAQTIPLACGRQAVADPASGPRQPGRAARRHRLHLHHRHLRLPHARGPYDRRRRLYLHEFHSGAVGGDPDAGVPVDGAEFRLPADGDGPSAQRGCRSGAARRPHRRRQPPPSGAASDRGMRPLGTQWPAVRAAGDRSRRLQGHQRHPWPCRGRRLPAALHPDGANPAAARRHAGAVRRRRVLHRAAVLDAARRHDDRPPRGGSLPCGCRAMHGQGYPDFGLDRGGAVDPGDRHLPRPPDRRRRPRALRRQEGRPELLLPPTSRRHPWCPMSKSPRHRERCCARARKGATSRGRHGIPRV